MRLMKREQGAPQSSPSSVRSRSRIVPATKRRTRKDQACWYIATPGEPIGPLLTSEVCECANEIDGETLVWRDGSRSAYRPLRSFPALHRAVLGTRLRLQEETLAVLTARLRRAEGQLQQADRTIEGVWFRLGDDPRALALIKTEEERAW